MRAKHNKKGYKNKPVFSIQPNLSNCKIRAFSSVNRILLAEQLSNLFTFSIFFIIC